MVTDPIQHGAPRSWRGRVVRGASYSKYDASRDVLGASPERHGGGRRAERASLFTFANVGFRLCLTLPCNDATGVVQ